MDKCIFCLRNDRPFSEEHIFPEAAGGVLTTRDQVCRTCNSFLGSEVDDPMVNGFLVQSIRLALGIEGKGGVPNPLGTGTLESDPTQGIHLRLDDAGKLVPRVVPKIVRTGDRVSMTFDASEKAHLFKAVNKVLARAARPLLSKDQFDAMAREQNLGHVSIAVPAQVHPGAHERGILKIAYEMGVRWLGPRFVDDPGAAVLRNCLMDPSFSGPDTKIHLANASIGFANDLPQMDAWVAGDPHANIAFTMTADSTIGCLVQVLGSLRGCVALTKDGSSYPAYEHMFYAQDPVTGEDRESVFLEELERLDDSGTLGGFLDERGA